MATKPFSQASENNKTPIFRHLQQVFSRARRVLEIGSGTGQHAVHFAAHLPYLEWQTSDLPEHHEGINQWVKEAGLPNLRPPIRLNVLTDDWPDGFNAVFSANTAHIMPWPAVEALFTGAGKILNAHDPFVLYGPFNYSGKYTSDSNARFDEYLRAVNPQQGIRDSEEIMRLAEANGLILTEDNAMPANNRLLVFTKV